MHPERFPKPIDAAAARRLEEEFRMGDAIATDSDEDEDDGISLATLKRRRDEDELPVAQVMRPTKKSKMAMQNEGAAQGYLLACLKAGKTNTEDGGAE